MLLLPIDIGIAPLELFCALREDVSQHISDLSLLLANLLENFNATLRLLLFLRLLILN